MSDICHCRQGLCWFTELLFLLFRSKKDKAKGVVKPDSSDPEPEGLTLLVPDIQRTAEIVYAATTSLRQANQGKAGRTHVALWPRAKPCRARGLLVWTLLGFFFTDIYCNTKWHSKMLASAFLKVVWIWLFQKIFSSSPLEIRLNYFSRSQMSSQSTFFLLPLPFVLCVLGTRTRKWVS